MKNEPAQNLEMKDFSLAVGTMPLTLCGPSALPAGGLSSGYINLAPCGRRFSLRTCGGRSIASEDMHQRRKHSDTSTATYDEARQYDRTFTVKTHH
jgi:hypothetical protein